jgi:DUF971 family protein
MVISIEKAEYQGNYRIRLAFSDQTGRVVDFRSFLKSAKNLMTSNYLDESLLQAYTIL